MTCGRQELERRLKLEAQDIRETDSIRDILNRIIETSDFNHPVLSRLVFECGLLIIDLSKDLKAAAVRNNQLEARMLSEMEFRKLLQETVSKEKERHYTDQKKVAEQEKACDVLEKRLASANSCVKFLRKKLTENKLKRL